MITLKSLVRQNLFWRSSFIGSGLLVSILLARSLKAAYSGSIYYDIALFSLYIQIAGLSLESGINYFAASKKTNVETLGVISIVWTLVISIIASGIYLIFGKNIIGIKSGIINAKMIVAFISGNTLYSYFSALFFAKLDFKTPNVVGTIVNSLVCLVTLLLLWGKINLSAEMLITFFLYTFLLKGIWIMIWHFAKVKFILTFQYNKSELRGLFKYSSFACLANVMTFLLYRADYYFVEKYCSAHALGNYIQVSKISQMFFLVPGMMSAVFFPILSSASDPLQYVDQINKSSKISLLLSSGGGIVLSISGFWLFPFLFGKDFNLMYLPFLLMMPGIIALCSIFHITAFFAARNMVIVNIKGTTISLILLLILDPIFIPLFGIMGAAIIIGVSFLFYTFYMLNAFKKERIRLVSIANNNLESYDTKQ